MTEFLHTEDEARALIARLEQAAERIDVPFEGGRLRWRRFGSGAPLLLVHGGHGSWLHWVRNIEPLATTHQLWLPDLPGCGDSDDLRPATLEGLVAAMRDSIATLIGPERDIGIAAFSFGGVVASNVAAARGHVSRMALIGATGHGLPRRPIDLRNWREFPPGQLQDDAHVHNLSQLMLHDRAAIDALALRVHRESALRTRLRSKAISHTPATRQALDRLAIPVLLAWGEHDPTSGGAATAHELAEGHPNRECVVMPGAGHWLQYERADAVNQLLRRWFD